jgi:hypothetical protein
MAININISNENKDRIFDNNSGRKYTAASVISTIVESVDPPKVKNSVSLEFAKDKFWKEILAWEYLPVTGRRLLHIATEDKGCFLSIFPDHSGIYLNATNRVEVFRRGENDTFKKAIEGLKMTTAGAENRLLVAINSAYFDIPYSEYLTYNNGEFIKYSKMQPKGLVVHHSQSFNSNYIPSPFGFHIGYKFNVQSQSNFTFGQGDPLVNMGEGIGASTPILIFNSTYNKVWKYGEKNIYQPGHTGPETGDPESSASFITTRSNSQYKAQNQVDSEGKNIIAFCKSKDCLLIITVPHGYLKGKNLDYYRDNLYRLGFENAIAVDGSTSVVKYNYSNKKYYAAPDKRKNNSIPLGLIFYV